MSTPARLTARTAALALAVGAAGLGLVAPAAAAGAAPAAAGSSSCSAPLDGVTVCLDRAPDPSGYNQLTARLVAAPGTTIAHGFVSVDGCSSSCHPLTTASGVDTSLIVTGSTLEGKISYRANASWVDGKGHRHLGVPDWAPAA
jgi:hypothetical protein